MLWWMYQISPSNWILMMLMFYFMMNQKTIKFNSKISFYEKNKKFKML